MNENDKPQAEDGKEKVGITRRRRITYVVLAAVALIALCFAFTFVIPRPSSEQAIGDEQQAAAEAQPNQSGDDSGQSDTDGVADETCDHDWTITYKTVHHDAVTHTETVKPVYTERTTYHTVCNECKQVIDGKADEHIKETGHSGYSTNVPITDEVLESEGYTKEVTDTPAYDETVPDKIVCTKCGAERPVSAEDAGQTD